MMEISGCFICDHDPSVFTLFLALII